MNRIQINLYVGKYLPVFDVRVSCDTRLGTLYRKGFFHLVLVACNVTGIFALLGMLSFNCFNAVILITC